MTALTTRPRVFLSSTIYDFADLRSALKFWLEELGYEVNASECNDFRKELDLNSYEACLKAIDNADYFILLIGSRAGGWFDEPSKVTITMQEYRHAYARAREGRLKIAVFVRQAVWIVREDRRGLASVITEQYAKERGISKEDIERIEKHKSRVVEDAASVFEFLSEVARNTEMKTAAKGSGALPPSNWVHQFSGFRDIVDALRGDFVGAYGLRRVALDANLRAELIENLRHLIQRSSGGDCSPAYRSAAFARNAFRGGPLDMSSIQGNHLMWLSLFALSARASSQLQTHALEEAVVSGEFLVFDRASNRYRVGPLQSALIQLRDEVERLKREEAGLGSDERYWLVENFRPLKDEKSLTTVENRRLVNVLSLHDRYRNVTELSAAVLRSLDGAPFDAPWTIPSSPFVEEAKQIESETPSATDIVAWIRKAK
jgi:hypothetical protein